MEVGMDFDYIDAEDSIFDTARIFSRRGGGIGEGFGDGVILCTRKKLYEEAIALSRYIKRTLSEGECSVLLVGGGMYDTAVLTVACSRIGCPLTLSEYTPNVELSCGLMIADHSPSDSFINYKTFLSIGELNAVILGELSGEAEDDGDIRREGFSVNFLNASDGSVESYFEQMAVRTAHRYANAEGIFPWDVCLSTLHPCSREGFFGGLLAPMLYAKKWFYCGSFGNVFEEMRLCAPTKLLCEPMLAERISEEMERLRTVPSAWHKGRGSHPIRLKLDKLFPKTRAALRRLKMIYVHYPFGGRLVSVAALGELSESTAESLADFGVLSASMLGIKRCALVGFRRYGDKVGRWRLPKGLFADMCDVGAGGIGRITFYGDGLSIGEVKGHTLKAGELRREHAIAPLLVSDIWGFSCSKGLFYAQK